jgi:hypothetical protein
LKNEHIQELPELNGVHFEFLKNAPAAREWLGRSMKRWACSIRASRTVIENMPAERFNRAALKTFITEHEDVESRFVAVMGWGKMRYPHARQAINIKERWIPLIARLTDPDLSRSAAFKLFKDARERPETYLNGMGVAYFTKLLFFLRPSSDAYIMDQWTGKSVNLLFSTDRSIGNVVKFDSSAVSDRNTPEDYEHFCQLIELLAEKLDVVPEDAEKRIFSNGGNGQKIGKWRGYVKRFSGSPKTT